MKNVFIVFLFFFLACVFPCFAQETASCELVLTPGWKAYALDFAPDPQSMENLRNASEGNSKIWVWRNGQFVVLSDTLGVGEGFYLKASTSTKLTLSETSGSALKLQRGWNLCSASRVSEGVYYWSSNGESFVAKVNPGTNNAVWIYAATLMLNGVPEQIASGSNVTKTAEDKSGHSFEKWTVDGVTVTDPKAKMLSFQMPANDVTLTTSYKVNSYTVTVDGVPETHEYNTQVTVTASDKTGYAFEKWTVAGVDVTDPAAKSLSFQMPANNVTLTTNYKVSSYTVTVDGTPETHEYNTQVTVTAPDKTGYTFKEWTVSGVDVTDPTTKTLSFHMPANDVTLTTNYVINGYTVTVDGANETYDYNVQVTVTAPEKTGYAFEKWTVTGVDVANPTAKTLVFTMPANDVALTTSYIVNGYSVTVDGVPETHEYDTQVTVTAPEKTGYAFDMWTVAGVDVADSTAKTLSFQMPANDVTLTTNYKVNSYSVTVDGATELHEYDTQVTVTAPEKSGYAFEKWTVTGVDVADSTAKSLVFTMPANDVTLTTNYIVNGYSVTVDGVPETHEYDTQVTVTAPEKTGYAFEKWTVTGVDVADSTAKTLSFQMPANDVTLTTNYKVSACYLTVDGAKELREPGVQIEVTAPEKTGHTFDKWTVEGIDVADASANPLVFTMPANDVTLTSNYTVNKYNLSVNRVKSEREYGSEVTVTAADKEGYTFRSWTIKGLDLDGDGKKANPLVFNMPANDVTLSANYAATKYALKVDGVTSQVECGEPITLNAADKSGYSFDSWTVDGITGVDASADPLVFNMPANDVTVTTNYVINGLTLTVDGESTPREYGSAVSVTAADKTGYTFDKWTVVGLEVTDLTVKTLNFQMPDNDVTLTTNYTINSYNLTVDGKSETREYGSQVDVSTSDKPGYSFSKWIVTGVDIANPASKSLSFTMPANDVTLEAHFIANSYGVTVNGTTTQYEYGSAVSVEAPTKVGHTFSYWTAKGISGVDLSANPLVFTMPANDVTLTPYYSVNSYSLIVDGTTKQQKYGTEVKLTAEEKAGHTFDNWTVTGVDVADATVNPLVFTMPDNEVTVTANYTIAKYNLTVDGTTERREYGSEVSVTAKGKTGYSFSQWTVTGVDVADATANPLTFIMPANEVTLTANYTVNSYVLTVDSSTSSRKYGSQVSVTAAAKAGYIFDNWTVQGVDVEDLTANPLTFIMPANDVTLTKNYSIIKYNLTVDGVATKHAPGEAITVTPVEEEGETFVKWRNITGITGLDENARTLEFAMPANDVSMESFCFEGGEYLVIDLTSGTSRSSTTPPDLSDDTCRTTELWLRRIPAGTFTMGSPEDEVGRENQGAQETQHEVTLTEDFYIGVFEMTQEQYETITGENPSYFCNADAAATRPVENVSYGDIRGTSATAGAGWPAYGHTVDDDSFLGQLNDLTDLVFDLPTEAQWEYACRGGLDTALNTGNDLTSVNADDAMDEAGRYWENGTPDQRESCGTTAGTAKVGSYMSNTWGLCDMHGNVWEWCLDRYQDDLGDADVTDPVGAESGNCRVRRGGCWYNSAQNCRAADRGACAPTSYNDVYGGGFRVVMIP